MTGSNNTTGYNASYGGQIAVSFSNLTAVVMYDTAFGGVIHSNNGAINPWGDNTYSTRSLVWAYRATNVGVAAVTFTTVGFEVESTDQLSEYNTSTGVFKAKAAGWYKIKARVLCQAVANGVQVYLRILHNYSAVRDICNVRGTGSDLDVSGDILIYANAGDEIILQIYSGSATTVIGGDQWTRLEIVRVA